MLLYMAGVNKSSKLNIAELYSKRNGHPLCINAMIMNPKNVRRVSDKLAMMRHI